MHEKHILKCGFLLPSSSFILATSSSLRNENFRSEKDNRLRVL